MTDDKSLVDAYASIYNKKEKEKEQIDEAVPFLAMGAKFLAKKAAGAVGNMAKNAVVGAAKRGLGMLNPNKDKQPQPAMASYKPEGEMVEDVAITHLDGSTTEIIDVVTPPPLGKKEEDQEALHNRLWDQVTANLTTLGEMDNTRYLVEPIEEKKKLDPVGKEDGDVDNDGDKDSSDSYLMKRRKAIGKAMAKEEFIADAVEDEDGRKKLDIMKGKKNKIKILTKSKTGTYDEAVVSRFRSVLSEEDKVEDKKKEEKEVDPRGMKTAISLYKNKLRAMGMKMEHHQKDKDGNTIPHEDEELQEIAPAIAAIPAVLAKGAAVVGKGAMAAGKVAGKAVVSGTKAVGKAAGEGIKQGVKAGAAAAGETVATAAGEVAANKLKQKAGMVAASNELEGEIVEVTDLNYGRSSTKSAAENEALARKAANESERRRNQKDNASRVRRSEMGAARRRANRNELRRQGKYKGPMEGVKPEGETIEENEEMSKKAYARAKELGQRRRSSYEYRKKGSYGVGKNERAAYNLSQAATDRNKSLQTQGGNQTGGGSKSFGYARNKSNPVKSKSTGDTGAIGHMKKRDEKVTTKKDGKTPLKTPRYKMSSKKRMDHHSSNRYELKDPKKNPKHTANTQKEAYEVTNADKKGNTPAYLGLKAGKKSKIDGKPMYKAADHMKEAKVDKPMIFGKSLARNERKFGKKGSTQPQGYFGQKPSQAAELSKKRTDEHKAKRGVKTKGLKEDKYISSFRDKLNNIK